MSIKQKIQALLPDSEKLKKDRYLKCLGTLTHDPNLWHINRHSVSGACAIGLASAWFLPPFQMLVAALLAVCFRKNIALATITTWITNPITYAPMMYSAYWFGALLIRAETIDPTQFIDELNKVISMGLMHSIRYLAKAFGLPLLVGSTVFAILSAAIGYFFIQWIWRYHVIKKIKERAQRGRQPNQ